MHVEHGGDGTASRGGHGADVMGHGARNIKAAPSQQLRSPGYIRILAIGKEIGIEEISPVGNVGDHLATVKSRGCAGSKHVFQLAEPSIIRFKPAAIEMPHGWSKIQPGRIDE